MDACLSEERLFMGCCRLNHPAQFSHAATVACSSLSRSGLAYLSRLLLKFGDLGTILLFIT